MVTLEEKLFNKDVMSLDTYIMFKLKEKTEALIDIEYSNYDQYDNKTLRHKIKGGVTVEGEINEYTYY